MCPSSAAASPGVTPSAVQRERERVPHTVKVNHRHPGLTAERSETVAVQLGAEGFACLVHDNVAAIDVGGARRELVLGLTRLHCAQQLDGAGLDGLEGNGTRRCQRLVSPV